MKRLFIFLVLFASLAECQSKLDIASQAKQPAGFAAAITGAASINIPSGTAPTTPAAGDIWRDGTGFNMIENASNNGAAEVLSNGTCAVSDANTVSYSGASNSAQVSENTGACQDIILKTKTQTVQNKTLDTTDTGIWQFLCTASNSATATVTCTPTTARKHCMCRLIITSYAGGGGVARAEFGNSTTPDTGTNYAFGGFNIVSGTSTAPTITGIGSGSTAQEGVPVSGSITTAGRFVQLNISNTGANIKYFTIETSGVGASAAVTPNFSHLGGTWNNTTNGIGVIQFKACSATTGTCTTVNFTSTLTCWGRDDS